MSSTKTTKEPPYLRGNPIFGSAYEMRRDPIRFLTETHREHGDFVRFRLGPYRIYLLAHPDHVYHVLQRNPRNYLKDGYEHIAFVGNGLLASEGDSWRNQRRIVQPAFHRERLKSMARTMTDAAEWMLARWKVRESHLPLDVDTEMSRLTLEIAGRTLFGSELHEEAGEVGRALSAVLKLGFRRTGRFFRVPLGIPTPENRRYKNAVRVLNRVASALISRRRRMGGGGDLLSMLLEARDASTSEGMDEQQLKDEVMTFLTAGYETTARALTWTWYLLDKNPHAAEKLHGELDRVLGGRAPGYEDLERLLYTRMVIQESMRLFPPVWGLSRLLADDDEVGGYRVPKGSRVVVSQYVTHRHPKFWEEPERFGPERFTPERSSGRERYAYFPFSGGPRQCIGNHFAMMEATLALATVARTFKLTLAPGHPVETEASFTLRPRYGMRMTLEER